MNYKEIGACIDHSFEPQRNGHMNVSGNVAIDKVLTSWLAIPLGDTVIEVPCIVPVTYSIRIVMCCDTLYNRFYTST